MYYSIEEPEIQSPEHRSVVLAWMAGYYSLMLVCIFSHGELFATRVPAIASMMASFTVLYFGCLFADRRVLSRLAHLVTVSFLLYMAVQVFLGSMVILGTLMMLKFDLNHWVSLYQQCFT